MNILSKELTEKFSQLVNMTVQDALNSIEIPYFLRVIMRDSSGLVVNYDISMHRVNVCVETINSELPPGPENEKIVRYAGLF
jgi:hypothetical protein